MRNQLTAGLFVLALVMVCGLTTAHAQGTPLEIVFCPAGSSTLPSGWGSTAPQAQITCGPNGIGSVEIGDNKIYNALYNDSARRLQTGRYMLTVSGAGGIARIKDNFNDWNFGARTRVVNLTGTAPIVNSLEFNWDRATQPNGLIELWGSSVKWLRLERQPDNVAARVPTPAIGSGCTEWTWATSSVQCTSQSASNLVKPRNTSATAKVTRQFDLPAGRYRFEVSTRGATKVQLSSGPDSALQYVLLDEPNGDSSSSFVKLSRLFNASGQKVTLEITAANANAQFNFKGVAVTPYVETTPLPATLAAERPTPWPAQGATAPGVQHVISSPPTDRMGNACARPTNYTTALADLRAWGADIARVDVPTISRATRSGCRLLADSDIYADGTVNRDKFWSEAWPKILDETQRAVEAAALAGIKVALLIEPPTPTIKLDTKSAGWVNQ
jgi:hypothetical protein